MRLIIEGFNKGLMDEETITRMGIGQISAGINDQEIRMAGCPATDINAMDFSTELALDKIEGRESLNSTPWKSSAIIRIYQWQNSSDVPFILALSCTSGAVSASIAAVDRTAGVTTFSTISATASSLSGWAPGVNDAIDITAYAGSAVMTYGASTMPLAVFKGDNSIAPLLGTNAPSGAKAITAWGAYLFAGNIQDTTSRYRSRIVWNNPLDVTSWAASNYIDLDTEDGDAITAMWVFKDVLVVFKRYKTFIVKYVGGVSQFDWERVDNSIGCVGPNAVYEMDGILYFMGSGGFYAFDGTHIPYCVSDNIERKVARSNDDVDYTNEVDGYELKGQVFFTLAEGSSTRKNKVYIYDPEHKSWTKWDIEVACMGNLLYSSSLIYMDFPNIYATYSLVLEDAGQAKTSFFAFGTYNGYIQKFGASDNDLGLAMDAYWVSPWIDFGYPDRNKRILRVTVFLDGTGDIPYTLHLIAYKDWNGTTVAVDQTFTTTGHLLDIAEKRVDFTMPCRAVKFKLEVNQLNAVVSIHKIIIEFLIKGRTLVG